jgi:carbamate kinase
MGECKGRIVIALGGNALQDSTGPPTAEAQLEVVKKTCGFIGEIVKRDYEIAIVHGNGPQVGRMVLASEAAKDVTPALPFDVCGAMSQGYIGYHIQQAMRQTLREINKGHIPVVSLVTQMVVDKNDPGFTNPSKPIGPFYNAEEAQIIAAETGYVMKEDAGRGWRRVVASPLPMRIIEVGSIRRLWDTTIVIACGGGGIPVVELDDGNIEGVAAVIDKDFAAELLAADVAADTLMILTEVEKIFLNYNKPGQKEVTHMTVPEAERYVAEGHFAPGSMLPKVQAGIKFAKSCPTKKAIITSLYKAVDALEGKTGTTITLQ